MNEVFAALGGTVWAVFFFVIALSVIVAIHEYGHYIVGRWTGIHAEVFSLGFGPVLASRTDRRGTKWQVAAVPFGGYVKFLGDANAASVGSSESPGLSAEERRHTMAGAPLWARALTVGAGPVANFILTFAVLVVMTLLFGIADGQPTVGRVVDTPWQGETLQPGDTILALNGTPTADYEAFSAAVETLPRQPAVEWTVERDGQTVTFTGPHPQPALVGSVTVKSAAVDAGLQAGDIITRAGGRDIVTFTDLQDVVFNSEGQPVALTVWRAGATFDLTLTPRQRDLPTEDGGFETKWLMGLTSGLVFEPATRSAGLGETISGAAFGMWDMTATTFSGLWHMIIGAISTCNMSGVVGMAEVMGDAAKAGPETFFTMIAVLSLGIGILNLFPIPVLDGGHLVFHAYEAVTGRPPSEKALGRMMTVGLTLLLSLMGFALIQDFFCV
ncbi:MAG: RIP metalloprotease RseP [Paracoccaceae bacterium]